MHALRAGLEQLAGRDFLHVRGARVLVARQQHVLHAAIGDAVAFVLALHDAHPEQLADHLPDLNREPLGLADALVGACP